MPECELCLFPVLRPEQLSEYYGEFPADGICLLVSEDCSNCDYSELKVKRSLEQSWIRKYMTIV